MPTTPPNPSTVRTYTPTQAAHALGCSVQTVRRYTALFTRHLSDAAAPRPGQHRSITDADLWVMGYVRRRVRAGVPLDDIDIELDNVPIPAHLAQGIPAASDSPAPIVAPSADAVGVVAALADALTLAADALTQSAQAHHTAQRSISAAIETQAQTVAHLQRQIDNLGHTHRRLALALAFVAGVGLALAAVWLALALGA